MSERVLLKLNNVLRLFSKSDAGMPFYQRYAGYDSWEALPSQHQGPRAGRVELARLAARVAELEAENAKLRKCVEAADTFLQCPNPECCREGCREGYVIARAEVDNG